MPSIQHTNDPVTVTKEELQTVVKKYIEDTTGRKVDGEVVFSVNLDHPHGPATVASASLKPKG